jgi:hypothetical protein
MYKFCGIAFGSGLNFSGENKQKIVQSSTLVGREP